MKKSEGRAGLIAGQNKTHNEKKAQAHSNSAQGTQGEKP